MEAKFVLTIEDVEEGDNTSSYYTATINLEGDAIAVQKLIDLFKKNYGEDSLE